MPTITIRIAETTRQALQHQAKQQGLNPSQLVREAINTHLGRESTEQRLDDHEQRIRDLERIAGTT